MKTCTQILNHFSHFCVLKKIKISMVRFSTVLAVLTVLFSCSSMSPDTPDTSLQPGVWRATLSIQGQELPFNFEVTSDSLQTTRMYILNADERILLDDITFHNDSVTIPLHIFDASIVAKIDDKKLSGFFIKHYDEGSEIPFQAIANTKERFLVPISNTVTSDFNGRYSVRFFGQDTTEAVGIFKQTGDSVTGTFLTTTGDYRYLQGNVINDTLLLSAFDGNHVYLFKATKETDGAISGRYYSGKKVSKEWVGIQNDEAMLPDATELTYMKEGFTRIEFSFPDADGNTVALNDPRFKDKVVIVQLMGSWCPNCMDETNFLVPWYEKNKERGVEIIGLAFERKPDFSYASERVKKMVTKLKIPYPVLIAGVNDKDKASLSLPMLNSVSAWPTTIYIGRDGTVKKIYTGFSGPGTGEAFEDFKQEFNETITPLIAEKTETPKI